MEWKVLYVGSAQDSRRDQVLDEILVGPVPVGLNKFVLQADPPAIEQLPADEVLGVTVVLVTCSYKEREFIRVGYYVNNEYQDPNAPQAPSAEAADGEQQEQPTVYQPGMDLTKVQRQILADKPRVTKFPIPWGNNNTNNNQADENVEPSKGTRDETMSTPTKGMDVE